MDLKAYCKERGIKQSRITRLVGIPKDRLCRLINGKPVNLTILELMKFCKFLSLKPSQVTSGYIVYMDSQKFYLKEKAPQKCANIEGLNKITTHSIPQLGESMEDNTQTLHQIVDMLQGIPKHQWDALVIEVNREYERNASKVMLTDVSGLKNYSLTTCNINNIDHKAWLEER